MKICFLVLSAPYEPWKTLERGPRETWLGEVSKDNKYRHFFYYGKKVNVLPDVQNNFLFRFPSSKIWEADHRPVRETRFVGRNEIMADVSDRWDTMAKKFFSAVELLLRTVDFDYLIKVNTTCYVNLTYVENFLSTPSDYFGAISKDKPFPSGWAAGYSRIALINLLQSVKLGSNRRIRGFDDEIIGLMMNSLGYSVASVNSALFRDSNDFNQNKFGFIRIKSTSNRVNKDVEIFKSLHYKNQRD